MARFAFVGGSYTSQSVNADCQRVVNWYPESIESQQGKSGFALYPTPGLTVFSQLPDSPLRGLFTINGRTFGVAGSTFFEIFTDGTFANRGAVANDGLMASITGGPLHILIASGGIGYALTLADNSFIQPLNMVSPRIVAYSDGYYLALQDNSDVFQFSTLLDATTWSLADVEQVSFFADNVLSMHVDHREICLFGAKQSIVYANTGDPNTPFLPINGAFAEQGSGAVFGNTKLDNTSFWIGANEHGGGIGWKAQGYTPIRVTNHAIEYAWQGYPTISDAISYAYQDQGHAFWVVFFPSANSGRGATWVFDVATSMWHERDHLENGVHYAHRSNCHTYAFGKHLVGGWDSGNIYQMAIPVSNGAGGWIFADDFGMPIQRLRRAPHISKEQEWQQHISLQVDIESGVGSNIPIVSQTIPTTIILAAPNTSLWSLTMNDNGTLQTTAGAIGIAQTLFMTDSSHTTSWQVVISNTGVLSTNSVAFNAAYPLFTEMVSSTGTVNYRLSVTLGGLLQSDYQGLVTREPVISLRWSDDGGHTWSNQYDVSAGAIGKFKTRAIWRRLGRSRDRVYEIQTSDPIPWRVVDAYLNADPDYKPSERLIKTVSKSA